MKEALRTFRYLKPYWALQSVALCCALIATVLGLVEPWIVKMLIDDVFVHGSLRSLNIVCIAFVGATVLRALVNLARSYLFTLVGERAVIDIRRQLFEHLQNLPMSYFNQEKTGRILSIFNNDVGAMQQLYTSTFADMVTNTFRMAVTILVLLKIDPLFACVSLPILPLFGVTIVLFSKPLRNAGARVQEEAARISEGLQEGITGIREVKSFTQERSQLTGLVTRFMSLLRARVRQSILGGSSSLVTELVAGGGIIFVLWWGGLKVIRHDMTAGVLVAFVQYLESLLGPTSWFVNLNVMLQGALAGAGRVFEFLDRVPEIRDRPGSRPLPVVAGRVAFEEVAFSYDGDNLVLADVSFVAEPGRMVALVGPSGAGKTTLVNLIPRFYDPIRGRVTMDEVDIRDVTQESLRRQIGLVFQDTFLFATSVKENLRFGRSEASDAEIIEAARTAHAMDFIELLPNGLDTEVGERGVKLSGGQKQRIAIARALLRNPRILILDEATSSLDSESEAAIQSALEALMRDRTSFVIAHRLSTILKADIILVLERGRIVEVGRHAELLARSGVYRRLHDAQFAGFPSYGSVGAEPRPLELGNPATLPSCTPVAGEFAGSG